MVVTLPLVLLGPAMIGGLLQRWGGFELMYMGMLSGAVLFTLFAMRKTTVAVPRSDVLVPSR